MDRILAARNAEHPGYRLHWGHVIYLVACSTAEKRALFEDRCVRNAWTPEILHQKIMESNGGPRRSGGRPLARPRGTDSQMRQIVTFTEDWLKRNEQVWQSETDGTFTALVTMPPDTVTEEVVEQTTNLREVLQRLVTASQQTVDLCNAALQYQQRCLEVRAASPPPAVPAPPEATPVSPVTAATRRRRIAST